MHKIVFYEGASLIVDMIILLVAFGFLITITASWINNSKKIVLGILEVIFIILLLIFYVWLKRGG